MKNALKQAKKIIEEDKKADHTYFSKMVWYQEVVCPKCGKQETIDYNVEDGNEER